MSTLPSEEHYRRELAEIARFPDMNPGPVLRMNFEGDVLLSNAAAQKVFGQDLHGKNWKNICPNITDEAWRKILSTENVTPVEATLGDKCFVFNHRTDPKTSLVFVFGSDITANKINERKLEEQKATITEIARFPDMNPGPVLRMDFNGMILLSNAAAENVFGEDLAGKNWKSVCPQLDGKMWNAILNTTGVIPVEANIGDKCFVFNHRTDPKTSLVFVFGSDITANKINERKLEEQKATITEIARFPHMNPGPVLRMDFDGKILLSNIAARRHLRDYTGKNVSKSNVHEVMMEMAYASVAHICITPMQDVLGLGEEARMNIPAAGTNNWLWRMQHEPADAIRQKLLRWARMYNR
jgi:hypothetical protein